jgi:hypothetical protein
LNKCVQTPGTGSQRIPMATNDNSHIYIIKLNRYILSFLVINLLLVVLMPLKVYSSNDTGNCHCFRNRAFNTVDKFASDDYLLTTTFNSLLASEFKISKRQIITMKMQGGVANDDLIIALYLSREAGIDVSQILNMKKKQPWTKIIRQLKTSKTPSKAEHALNFITAETSDDQVSNEIINRIIIARFPSAQDSLELLKKQNLTSKEIILAYTLAKHADTPVFAITDQYKQNDLSWSEIAHNFGLEPANVGKLLYSEDEPK